MLVVGDPGQSGVERHHDERELGERAQQARSVPGETGLQVQLRQGRDRLEHREEEEEEPREETGGGHSPPGKAWCTWRRTRARRRTTS